MMIFLNIAGAVMLAISVGMLLITKKWQWFLLAIPGAIMISIVALTAQRQNSDCHYCISNRNKIRVLENKVDRYYVDIKPDVYSLMRHHADTTHAHCDISKTETGSYRYNIWK